MKNRVPGVPHYGDKSVSCYSQGGAVRRKDDRDGRDLNNRGQRRFNQADGDQMPVYGDDQADKPQDNMALSDPLSRATDRTFNYGKRRGA